MTATTSQIAIGTECYVLSTRRSYIHLKTKVVKVTPSGRIVVAMGGGEATATFKAESFLGKHDEYAPAGIYKNDGRYLTFNVAAVEARAAADKLARAAANAICAIHDQTTNSANPLWSKETMLDELTRIEALVAAARTAVEAR